jgi:hypothetical protein
MGMVGTAGKWLLSISLDNIRRPRIELVPSGLAAHYNRRSVNVPNVSGRNESSNLGLEIQG